MKHTNKLILFVLLAATFVSGCDWLSALKRKEKEKVVQKTTPPEKKDQYRDQEFFWDNKTQIIDLIEGPATFDIKYDGDSSFVVHLLNNDGDLVEVLADVTGPYKATKTFNILTTSSYLLDVRTKGRWSIYKK